MLNSRSILAGISDSNGVLLEVEWDEICRELKVERIVPVNHKTDVLGFASISSGKVSRVGCVEES